MRVVWPLLLGVSGIILLLETLSVTAQPSTLTEETVVWLKPSSDSITVGEELTITIRISDVVDLYGAQVTLAYVTTTLQVVDANPGQTGIQIERAECPAPDFIVVNSADNAAATIDYAVTQLNPTPPFTGDCSMAHIRLQTQQAITTQLHFEEVILADANGQQITTTSMDLELQITPPPLIADFSATPTTGISPLTVRFTNLSSGDHDSCTWDFGDGSTSTDCSDPTHTYTGPGNYNVSLEVNGPGESDTETKVNYITVYEPVAADFSAAPTSGIAPLNVAFTNLSSGDYDTCLWDLGDGNRSSNCNDPNHTYAKVGSYSVTLTVEGPGGNDSQSRSELITVMEPDADFYFYVPFVATEP